MKEIKAYIRRSRVNQVVHKLEEAGAPGITIVEVPPVGYGYEPNYFEQRFEDVLRRYAHLNVVKLEVVCRKRDVGRLVQVIRDSACTGDRGDGLIFVSEVEMAVRIRDAACRQEALAAKNPAGETMATRRNDELAN